jgi:magnesium transporter
MLTFHNTAVKGHIEVDLAATALPAEVNWIDAFRPDAREVAFLQRILGIQMPSFEKLSEIETSSRLYSSKDHLYLTVPMVFHTASELTQTTPLGFVLGKDNVLTIRFKPIKACDHLHFDAITGDRRFSGGPGALISLLEVLIDQIADELERLNGDLDGVSRAIFGGDGVAIDEETLADRRDLRRVLRKIGRIGGFTSKINEVLLGLSRMIPFVTSDGAEFLSAETRAKLKGLNRDVSSLNDYEKNQTDKIQFLLDATLGLTNIDQNNIFKLLTLVSVVGIPPTLVASIYGMNFKNMPELDWTYGYAYGLALIAVSAIVPLILFKWRGWW